MIAAPEKVTKDFIKGLNIQAVVHGKEEVPPLCEDGSDPYEIPKAMGIYVELESDSSLTTSVIVDRIVKNRQLYEDRNTKKEAKELAIIEEHDQASKQAGLNE